MQTLPGVKKDFFNYDTDENALREIITRLRIDVNAPEFDGNIIIRLDDIALNNAPLASNITHNFPTYKDIIQSILIRQRIEHLKTQATTSGQDFNKPGRLFQNFQLTIMPRTSTLDQPTNLRAISAETIGKLHSFRATVTFISQIIPECEVATFTCETCGSSQYLIIPNDRFMPPKRCDSQTCQALKKLTTPIFDSSSSGVNPLRIAILQEVPAEIPDGQVPRIITIHMRIRPQSDIRPGDQVLVWGTLMPVPSEGNIYRIDPVFYAEGLQTIGRADKAALHQITAQPTSGQPNVEATLNFEDLKNNRIDLVTLLINSFAPKIHGRTEEKLACLCALVGGAPVDLPDLKIRGNINVLLAGDPGCAKSQLLKFACSIAERSVYVAGRGASGAGLTCAAMKIPGTNDFTLEGGALVIADKGLCALDEFDKIDETDRTSIYEVLESGTLSISKAGITATLNARTTVLAAANPRYSRWDVTRSVKENLNLPEALVSRFDIIFIIRDRISQDTDFELARHVADLHKKTQQDKDGERGEQTLDASNITILSERVLKEYIAYAKSLHPVLSRDLTQKFVDSYVQDRREKVFVTPRALLSTIRISQAIAKLRLSEVVSANDVDIARSLLHASEESISTGGDSRTRRIGLAKAPAAKDTSSATLRKVLAQFPKGADENTLRRGCLERGMDESEFIYILERNLNLGIVSVAKNNNYILK